MMILFEVIATASFFHTFLSMNMSLEKITNLYIVTTISTSIFNVLLEIIDIGSKKDKCILSTILYCVSMSSVFLGGHHKMLSLGRIAYGAGAALQHSVFEAYVIHEHTTRGFLDDWLTQTFSLLTHSMTLIAVVAGFSGQLVSSSQYGPVGLCWILCIISGFYILTTWSKDTSVGSKFLLSGFIFNVNQTVTTIKNSKATLLLLVISALFESTITIFTFYWAPWLLSTIGYSNEHSIPYEILFSTFVGCSMLGNYIYQIGGGNFVLFGTFDVTLQSILISASTIFALGAMLQTTLFAYITCLLVHLFIGGYWSSIGALRGSIILPEQRNTWQLFVKIITTIISSATLATIHHRYCELLYTYTYISIITHIAYFYITYVHVFYIQSDDDAACLQRTCWFCSILARYTTVAGRFVCTRRR